METPKTKRTLSEKEVERLKKLKFPPRVEKIVREIWEMAEEKKDYTEMFFSLQLMLSLVVLNLFIAGNSHEIIETVRGVLYFAALAIVMVFFIGAAILRVFAYSKILASEDRKIILDPSVIYLFDAPKGLWKIISTSFISPFLILTALCIFSNNLLIAFLYFFIEIYKERKEVLVVRKAVQEIRKIKQEQI